MNPTATLKPEANTLIQNGYPRVLRANIAQIVGDVSPGDIADVLDSHGNFIGRGSANPHSRVFVRMLSYDPAESIDDAFFYNRLVCAQQFRDAYSKEMSYRAVFSESDGLPGLTVDRFEEYLVCQINGVGIEVRRAQLFSMLQEIYKPRGIFEKSRGMARKSERLERRIETVFGECPRLIPFQLHGLTLLNELQEGQKTGFFLDQRDNREAVRRYVTAGAHVLDGFSYTGCFALVAAQVGAEVMAFDISERALAVAQDAAVRNGLQEHCTFQQANAFEMMRELEENRTQFDMVILDPPAFAKHKGVLPKAIRAYLTLNRRAMKLLREGGILVSCSCTQLVSEAAFLEVLVKAARDVKRHIRFLEIRGQPFDHPVLATLPETRYLKCVIVQVVA
jgi:23S rRNA (cytosine1962-C5)-methyltransferase